MAKTVAEIDGDSSGLVSELGQAKKAMGDLGGQGKKLSDQLKEVGDQADIAAGNLVQKLGGPNAVKAIGAITIGFAAAQKGVEMFLDSSEKLFRSYGQNGQALWDDLEKQLNDIQGSFAKAVLQTDDLYLAYGRLYATLELIKDMSSQLVDSAITGINLLRKIPGTWADILEKMGLFEAFDRMSQEGEARAHEMVANMEKTAKAFAKPVEAAKTLDQTIDEMAKSYAGLTGSSVSFEEQQRKQALAAIDNTVKQVEALALLQNMADNMSGENVGGLTDAQLESLERLGKLRQDIVEGAKTEPPKASATGGSKSKEGDKKETLEELIARVGKEASARVEAREEEARALAELTERNNKEEQDQELEKLRREDDAIQQRIAKQQAYLDFVNKMEQDHIDELHAQGKLTAKEQEELDKARLEQAKGYLADYTTAFMQSQGRQLAIGKLSAKEAGDFARKQLGNAIMGLGDKAMAEAGIMAASLNPLAIPMAAAGVAAYAVGSALNADKKQVATEPPTEVAGAQAQPASYSFNLQVDSVFADGESVARQFARMQESARQRGLLTQGAY